MDTKLGSPARHALVLAAGKGTRFKSQKTKVLHELCGKPMVCHVLDRLLELDVRSIFLVVGRESDDLKQAVSSYPVSFILQEQQLGTGHAVLSALPLLEHLEGSLLVLYGDAPLIGSQTLQRLLTTQQAQDADQVLLTCRYQDPFGCGRIIRGESGQVIRIVEETDASPEQKKIREVNPGFYCYKLTSLPEVLTRLNSETAQGEYYLTDTVELLSASGKRVVTVEAEDPEETRGVNDRLQLSLAERVIRNRINRRWMLEGVTLRDPDSIRIDSEVQISRDVIIHPGAEISGQSRIGTGCTIGAQAQLEDTELAENVRIEPFTVIRGSRIGSRTSVGPFAYLRNNTVVGQDVRIGSFVEVKHSVIEDETISAHLSYLGDAQIGKGVNIGAGTITCNYDGVRKNTTRIEDRVFVGSNTAFVAPVTVHEGAWIAAGSVITEDVPADSLAIAREHQSVKEGWVKRHRSKQRKDIT